MDNIDLKILELLKENSRMTATAISKSINLSVPAVTERIKQLEETDIISGYTLKINHKAVGYGLQTFIFISIESPQYIEGFKKEILQFSEILECHHIAGEYDYLLKVLVKDTDDLEVFITHKLKTIKGVHKSNTLFSLSSIKNTFSRIPELND